MSIWLLINDIGQVIIITIVACVILITVISTILLLFRSGYSEYTHNDKEFALIGIIIRIHFDYYLMNKLNNNQLIILHYIDKNNINIA